MFCKCFRNVSEAFLEAFCNVSEMFQKHIYERFENVLEGFLEMFQKHFWKRLEMFQKHFWRRFGNVSEAFLEIFQKHFGNEMICYDSLLFGFESIHFLKDLLILYCFISVLFQRITWEAQTRGLR